MAHGGMSPRGGLSGVSADADARWEGEPAPSTGPSGDASSGVRVTLADSTRAHLLRAFLREHRERRVSRGETAPSSVDALLDSMESARRETSSLARAGEGAPARVRDDVFSFGGASERAFGIPIRSGSASSGNDDASLAASAERETRRGSFDIDTRAAALWLEHAVPVWVILLVAFLLDRVASLAAFAWTAAAFSKADDGVRRAAALLVGDDETETEARGTNSTNSSRTERQRRYVSHDGAPRASDALTDESPTRVDSRRERDENAGEGSGDAAGAEGSAFVPARLSRVGTDGKDTSMAMDAYFREERNKKRWRRFMRLIAAFALSVVAIGVLAAAFPAEPFWDALAFGFARYESGGGSLAGTRHTRAGAFLDHLWRAAMADIVVRLGTVGVKALVLLIADAARARDGFEGVFHKKKRRRREKDEKDAFVATNGVVSNASRALRAARLRRRAESCRLACVEHASLTVRTMMPVTTWFPYFMRGAAISAAAKTPTSRVGVLFLASADARRLCACFAAGAYLAVKLRAASERLAASRAAALALLETCRDVTGLGAGNRESSAAELAAVGNECTVCCDAFESPVTLCCGHVFCERCVGAWFERSRACPLCRAEVAGKHCGMVEHGNGATVAWPYAF